VWKSASIYLSNTHTHSHTYTHTQGGLQAVANALTVPRVGRAHQAGSDALLTMATFFKLKEVCVCVCVYVCWPECELLTRVCV
jgi:hypothetical protein